jgi:2-polyprenyl-3-methyl-5-hydroxy-6-metoxy-1,4-benzoquinol methylase
LPCIVCGSDRVLESFKSVEPGFHVEECEECGLGRTAPAVAADKIGSFYPDTYYGKENVRFNVVFEWLTRIFRWRRARVIRSREKPGPVLDVGCGRGLTLAYLREFGFEPKGVEFSDTAAWHARHALGLEVETGDFMRRGDEKGRYHAVIFWHSLEHMADPVSALRRAHELLKPGGLVVVAVPNYSSLQARLFGRHWFHLDVPRHYFHFSQDSLEKALRDQGFRVVQRDHFSFEQNPYGWLQSALNALGFQNNFLYTLLKNRTARTTEIRKHPIQAALTVLLAPPLTVFALIMTVIEAGVRRGGTIEYYCAK